MVEVDVWVLPASAASLARRKEKLMARQMLPKGQVFDRDQLWRPNHEHGSCFNEIIPFLLDQRLGH